MTWGLPNTLTVEEDGGISSLMGSAPMTLTRDAALGDGAILAAARDALQASFAADERKHFMDPFAPAAERNAEVVGVLRDAVSQHRQRGGLLARVPTDDETLLALFAATIGWGPAQRYLDDPRVNEIKIIGTRMRVQEAGKPFVTVPERFNSVDEVMSRAMLLAQVLGVKLDANLPQSTLPVAHGTRMHVTIPPRVPKDNTLVCIRRGRRECWDIDDVLKRGTVDRALADLLRLLSRARCSFLIVGRTGSGKTGMLEALANSWPGEPHIVTIEDHTAEIGIRRTDLWTREHVNTEHDPLVFGRVAKEAMRQTPDLLLPGETRGNEAGAILAMVLSDHPVMTTLHARSCLEAAQRFASFAAMPGAYMYEGRRDDALRDTCLGFDVVIKMDVWEDLGIRLITEVALLDGSEYRRGSVLEPRVIPLAAVEVQPDGHITWRLMARAGVGGMLEWVEGQDQTPQKLREKLVRARAMAQIRTAATSLDLVAEAISRASRHLQANEAARALATLRGAWVQRRDGRLIASAQQALAHLPGGFTEERAAATARRADLDRLLQGQRWRAARQHYDLLIGDLVFAAVAVPTGGWSTIETQITAGLALEAEADEARIEAELALGQHQARVAVDILSRFTVTELSVAVALPLICVREAAMEQLMALGEGSEAALSSVRAQRMALERALMTEQQDDVERRAA
ncbi:MAG TPA: ATPase, T2SS/T4P/T4SS family [Roseiflexaceae bacterium]|nr:ATPase, T2SS/T4P/T4SS family [Roseiflexaceae bacterium]